MIGNVALDVVIGLVFVYLLYSLYATVIMEIVASFLGLRARNLLYAIRRMLMDEKEYEGKPLIKRLSRVGTSFIQLSGYATNLKKDDVFKKFMNQPAMQSLRSGGVNNAPSYLKAENFTKAIIDTIKTDHPDLNEVSKILEGLSKLDDSAVKTQLTSLMSDANNDLVKFRILIEEWFNDTMDRSTGWYKRSVQGILMITAVVIAITFNVDTLAIIQKLSTDENAREQMVALATKYMETHKDDPTQAPHSASANVSDEKNQDSTGIKVNNRSAALDSLYEVKKLLKEDIEKSRNVLSSAWNLSSPLHFYQKNNAPATPPKDSVFIDLKLVESTSIVVVVHKSVDVKTLQSVLPHCLNKEGYLEIPVLWYKLKYVWQHLAGYLLTVLAIALGAPFWFDLLNKLVKLKTSQSVVESDKNEAAKTAKGIESNRAILNRIG